MRQGSEELTLTLPGMVTLEVKAEQETSRSGKIEYSLEVELEWKPSDGKQAGPLELG